MLTKDQIQIANNQGLANATEFLMAQFSLDFEAALKQAAINREDRRQLWLRRTIDPLAKKHGTTRDVVISFLYFDNTPEGPYTKDAYWAEANDFALMTKKESVPQ